MRRTLIGGSRRIRLGLLQPLAEFCDPPRQRVDLLPLCGDGLVQRLDRVVLIGEPRLQRVDALAQTLDLIRHGLAPYLVPASSARANRGRARRARRTRSIRRASGSAPPAPLPDI